MDKRAKLFPDKFSALGQIVINPVADGPANSTSLGYRPPEIVRLGRAVKLVKQSSSGQLIDGNDGWWVWGS